MGPAGRGGGRGAGRDPEIMRLVAIALVALACCSDAWRLEQAPSVAARRTARDSSSTLLALRGGADATGLWATCTPWLRVLRRLLFPGNPPRERAPYVPPPPAPPPAAAASEGGGGSLNRGKGSKGRKGKGKAVAGTVTHVHNKKEFDALLASARSKQLVVVDFAASWCGPCQQIAPKFEAIAAALPQARFLKVDVDECKDLSQEYKVQSMPTFKMIRAGKVVDEMKGADENALREKIEALAGKADRWASAGQGRTL